MLAPTADVACTAERKTSRPSGDGRVMEGKAPRLRFSKRCTSAPIAPPGARAGESPDRYPNPSWPKEACCGMDVQVANIRLSGFALGCVGASFSTAGTWGRPLAGACTTADV